MDPPRLLPNLAPQREELGLDRKGRSMRATIAAPYSARLPHEERPEHQLLLHEDTVRAVYKKHAQSFFEEIKEGFLQEAATLRKHAQRALGKPAPPSAWDSPGGGQGSPASPELHAKVSALQRRVAELEAAGPQAGALVAAAPAPGEGEAEGRALSCVPAPQGRALERREPGSLAARVEKQQEELRSLSRFVHSELSSAKRATLTPMWKERALQEIAQGELRAVCADEVSRAWKELASSFSDREVEAALLRLSEAGPLPWESKLRAELQEQGEDLGRQVGELARRADESTLARAVFVERCDAFEERQRQCAGALQALSADVAGLAERSDDMEECQRKCDGGLQALRGDALGLAKRCSSVEERQQQCEDALQTLRGNAAGLAERVNSVQERANVSVDRCNGLEGRCEATRRELQKGLEELRAGLSGDFQKGLNELHAGLGDLHTRLGEVRGGLGELHTSHGARLAAVEGAATAAGEAAARSQGQGDAVRRLAEEAGAEARAAGEAAAVAQARAAMAASLREALPRLEAAADTLTVEVREVRAEASAAASAAARARAEAESARGLASGLAEAAAGQEAVATRGATRIGALEGRCEELQRRLDRHGNTTEERHGKLKENLGLLQEAAAGQAARLRGLEARLEGLRSAGEAATQAPDMGAQKGAASEPGASAGMQAPDRAYVAARLTSHLESVEARIQGFHQRTEALSDELGLQAKRFADATTRQAVRVEALEEQLAGLQRHSEGLGKDLGARVRQLTEADAQQAASLETLEDRSGEIQRHVQGLSGELGSQSRRLLDATSQHVARLSALEERAGQTQRHLRQCGERVGAQASSLEEAQRGLGMLSSRMTALEAASRGAWASMAIGGRGGASMPRTEPAGQAEAFAREGRRLEILLQEYRSLDDRSSAAAERRLQEIQDLAAALKGAAPECDAPRAPERGAEGGIAAADRPPAARDNGAAAPEGGGGVARGWDELLPPGVCSGTAGLPGDSWQGSLAAESPAPPGPLPAVPVEPGLEELREQGETALGDSFLGGTAPAAAEAGEGQPAAEGGRRSATPTGALQRPLSRRSCSSCSDQRASPVVASIIRSHIHWLEDEESISRCSPVSTELSAA